jgi:hypothetical protein
MVCDARIDDTLGCPRDLARESAETQKFNVLLLLTSWERVIQLRDSIAGSQILVSPSHWMPAELNALYHALPSAVHAKWTAPSMKDGGRSSSILFTTISR